MRIPIVRGIIERRILVNYRIDPAIVARVLPAPFRPLLVNGYALGGICLIRLQGIRPRWIPGQIGLTSENAAHRIAVEWEADGQTQHGVYIPRRDTSSRIAVWGGGSIFPGLHHRAKFNVQETSNRFLVSLDSSDGETHVQVAANITSGLTASVFASLSEAVEFFQQGSLGYSPTQIEGNYDGLELRCQDWLMEPLALEKLSSSFFENEAMFPKGSIEFDSALLMRGIHHEWHGRKNLCCETQVPRTAWQSG